MSKVIDVAVVTSILEALPAKSDITSIQVKNDKWLVEYIEAPEYDANGLSRGSRRLAIFENSRGHFRASYDFILY